MMHRMIEVVRAAEKDYEQKSGEERQAAWKHFVQCGQ